MTADGVDVSVVGKAEEKELLKKISPKRVKSEVIKNKSITSGGGGGSGSGSGSGNATKAGRPKRSSNKVANGVTNTTPVTSKAKAVKGTSSSVKIRRSTRSAGSKTPNISPVSSKTSPKGISIICSFNLFKFF